MTCSYKVSTLCIIAFLLISLTLANAIRPEPAFAGVSPVKSEHRDIGQANRDEVEENCVGVEEEECLMRRTLAAHIDYIYTQKNSP
ncbi:hypothetical protein JCGZ_16377 [Jatropha curcas]|uniref:Phytosulfokine n=1 Tax=Jatropha curcas TaxID=180498 RepID=A0A067LJS1_JATCU|nr:phytosulfokines [Jatropha curcas]KDP44544.1 hypothetical protein JCGZ_16377 [Jatropha curcas]